MSRIGIQPVTIEDSVKVEINGKELSFVGPLGNLSLTLPEVISAKIEDNSIKLTRSNEEKQSKSLHGTYRSLIANAVNGVKNGYTKKLQMSGVGYRVSMQGNKLSMTVGYTHPIVVEVPEGLSAEVPDEITMIIKGIDKQKVGLFASKIKNVKKPEPYKGKGISFEGEYVRRKSAKSATATK